MANILEFLRELLTTEDEQRRFVANPHQYLQLHEFDHLSGEDVAEAIPVLMQSLPRELSDRLAPYDSGNGDDLTPVRPLVGESDLDAAIRQLTFATTLATGREFDPAELEEFAAAAPEEPVTDIEVADEEVQEDVDDVLVDEPEPVAAADTEPEPEPAKPGLVYATGEAGRSATSADDGDPFAGFGEEMAEIVRFAHAQVQELIQRAEAQREEVVHSAEREAENIRGQAEEEANSLRFSTMEEAQATRNAAQSDAHSLRQTAQQEADAILQAAKSAREEARIFKQAAKDDANAVLQSARSAQEEAQRHATELVKNAEKEASAMLAEARARRDEIREAERQLRKRLQGVESVFRTLQEGDGDDT